jgi:chromosome segregation and condensation protein ScpB
MSDESLLEPDPDQIIARIEALLFVAAGAVMPVQLATALNLPLRVIEQNLDLLENQLNSNSTPHGLRLQRHHGRVQLTTSPEMSVDIERFLDWKINKLSRGVGAVAIIAYQQPVTDLRLKRSWCHSDGVLKACSARTCTGNRTGRTTRSPDIIQPLPTF